MSYIAMTTKPRKHYEALERMLNKTTLTTQRVAHGNIVDLGGHMVSTKAGDFQEEHDRELQEAVEEAEERATRELKAALKRLNAQKEDEKNRALYNQKMYYEKIQKRVEEQRNRAEAERERELRKQFLLEKEVALQEQLEESERLKVKAVEEACIELEARLREEFAIERARAVAEALRIAQEEYLIREQKTIERTKRECAEIARKEAERVAKIHQNEIDKCNQRYDVLEKKWRREIDHRKYVEKDFRELQDDYRRFMNYTDGMFHSDYLMKLRHTGQILAEKVIPEVSYEDIEPTYEKLMEENNNTFTIVPRPRTSGQRRK